jgi:4-amino-4-deoxy-L-arabinose transferase-like glycosyltransferase
MRSRRKFRYQSDQGNLNTSGNIMALLRTRKLWLLLLGVGLLRLLTSSMYPLLDPTEARYGEIARIMAETGNWIVPQIDYGTPFWGKPPLSFWASALSISLFENSEFFLRLPHIFAAAGVLFLVWYFVRALDGSRRQADIAAAVIATTIGFLVAAGSVMTDMFLCLAMTLTMTGFWRGWHGEKAQVYLMYTGLGIGLLAKGPVIIILVGVALFPWLVIHYGIKGLWRPLWQRLHLPSGILLMLAITIPWYWLAERESPGFLEYFILGEHFQRFIDSGWKGDLYGSGHAQIRGTIWIYWLVVAIPWSPLLLIAAGRTVLREHSLLPRDQLTSFALLWMCSPMLLFTLAGNILPAYVVPGLPAIGLLMMNASALKPLANSRYLLLVGPAMLLIIGSYAALIAADEYSDKDLLARGIDSGDALYYLDSRPYSAQYYSNGQATLAKTVPLSGRFYLVIKNKRKPAELDSRCELRSENDRRRLFFCQLDAPA